VMKLVQVISIFTVIFMVTITTGDGAPQWRPQGRFGKRQDQRISSSWLSESHKDIDLFPVLECADTSISSENPEQTLSILGKLCIETNIPGLYRCFRYDE
ncbi:hypothetical protein FSP39_005883, partial [Pinctada imbricata]